MDEHERIIISFDLLRDYISRVKPDCYLHSVPGDGLCILNSFRKSFEVLGEQKSINELKASLLTEVTQNPHIYESVLPGATDIIRKFVEDPLAHYQNEAVDIIIPALSKYFNVNVVTLQADDSKCWTNHTLLRDNKLKTLYFGKSMSDHFDPILPIKKEPIVVDLCDSDSDIDLLQNEESHIRPVATNHEIDNYGDVELPYFKSGSNVPFNTLDVVKLLLLENIAEDRICNTVPQNVRENKEYVISKSALKDDRDVFSDGHGHWTRTGTKGKLEFGRKDDIILKISEKERPLFSETFTVRRVPAYFRTCKNFHRSVLFVPDAKYIYVQYYFDNSWDGTFIDDVAPHGNSKRFNAQPYNRTKASVQEMLKVSYYKPFNSLFCNKMVLSANLIMLVGSFFLGTKDI